MISAVLMGVQISSFSCLADENPPPAPATFKADNSGSFTPGGFAHSQANAELGRIGDSSVGVWGAADSNQPFPLQIHSGPERGIQGGINSVLSTISGISGVSGLSGGLYLRQDF
jgi:hypothetical protein